MFVHAGHLSAGLRCGAFLVYLAGCDLDVTSRVGGHPEVAGAVLISETGEALTPVVRLPAGGPHEVTVEFRDAADRPIESLRADHASALIWEPAGLVTTRRLADDPFGYEIGFPLPCAAPEQLRIAYGHDARVDERIFGPYPVEVTGMLGSGAVFGPSGEELTPEVHLPSQTPVRIELRFYDCEEKLVTGLEDDHEALLFWSSGDFAEWTAVPDSAFHQIVTVQEPPGTEGTMSIGLRRMSGRAYQAFGPYRVVVTEGAAPE